ncbi:MAG: class I SAM-dependent methyltransferase [Verrucomicrobiota bacterium]
MSEQTYVGGELALFAHAHRWKAYWISRLRPFLGGAVLEVGAGIGSNTLLLRLGNERRWVCLEPDAQLAAQLKQRIAETPACRNSEVHIGTLESLASTEVFDTILYIDVLEHIEDDCGELRRAARHLAPGGRLVVLSPAHGWLFSPFDKSIGHFRRYTAKMLASLTPPELCLARAFYLDSVGLLASAANRLLLRQSLPTLKQIQVWDRFMIPCSRILDPLTGHRLGKTVVGVWERPHLQKTEA